MLGLKHGIVKLCAHELEWEKNARRTIDKLKSIFGTAASDIQHVGSTSVTGIMAKPIIDIAVGVRSLGDTLPLIPALEEAGFIHRPENDEDWQFYFVRLGAEPGITTHHIHVVTADGKEWNDYIAFRNYLEANPDSARGYEKLKLELTESYERDRPAYTEGKSDFVRGILKRAGAYAFLGKTVTVTVDRPAGSPHPRRKNLVYPINYGYIEGVLADCQFKCNKLHEELHEV